MCLLCCQDAVREEDAITLVLGETHEDDDVETNCNMTNNDPEFWSAWGSGSDDDGESVDSWDSWDGSSWDGVCVINPAVAFDYAMASSPEINHHEDRYYY